MIVVVCAEPAELGRWVSARPRPLVDLVGPGDVDLRPVDDPAEPQDPSKRRSVRLPLDGPDTVLPLAAARLRSVLTRREQPMTVIAEGPGGIPPKIEQLAPLVQAGLSVGVDLTSCPWVTEQDAFLITRFGAARMPLHWPSPTTSRDLAQTLLATGQPLPDTPLGTWLEATARSFSNAPRSGWMTALQALYVDSIADGLEALLRHAPASRPAG